MKESKKKSKSSLWVVKVGSAIFTEGGPLVVRSWMKQVAELNSKFGIDVVWVSSGAIASARLRTNKNPQSLKEKQALSAIGQPLVMEVYNLALNSERLTGAQVLLSYHDLARTEARENLKNTLKTLLSWSVLPILNENDATSTEEIQFGDNDLLSAKVAALMKADRLILLTNVEGLYDANPQVNPDAKLINELPKVTSKILEGLDKNAVSTVGRGGMYSKLKAAQFANKNNIVTYVVNGEVKNSLLKIANNEMVGTRIGPLPTKKTKKPKKKKWVSFKIRQNLSA